MRQVDVCTAEGAYHVEIGNGLLGNLGGLADEVMRADVGRGIERVFVVADAGLGEPTRALVRGSLESMGARVGEFVLSPTERVKSLATLEEILCEMARFRLERGDLVVAVGGGIVGDVAGFAAASYRRGVAVVQCPTTLLAMVDASVGGKTGVNLTAGAGVRKNFVGAFHQPTLVVADIGVLETLDDRYFKCGLAECIKHGMMASEVGEAGKGLGDWIRENLERILTRDAEVVGELVVLNVAVKAAVVGADTREMNPAGGRALLNLGHTFAHAIEPMPGLSPDADANNAPLLHGEAVSLGLVAAARCSVAMGLCDEGLAEGVEETLSRAGLPTSVTKLPDTEQVASAMFHDKKVSGGRLRLVLPTGDGHASVVAEPPMEAVQAGIEAIRG